VESWNPLAVFRLLVRAPFEAIVSSISIFVAVNSWTELKLRQLRYMECSFS
jgi:hypothetical protein